MVQLALKIEFEQNYKRTAIRTNSNPCAHHPGAQGFRFWYGRHNKVLEKRKPGYQKISYDSVAVGPEDFIDINKNGEYEVIIGSLYEGKKHNYIEYSIYKIENYRLVNANAVFKKLFPKFIWMTEKSNDKDTVHLTRQEREDFIKKKNAGIMYKSIL